MKQEIEQEQQASRPESRAAIFVDYENLYNHLKRLLPESERPSIYISEILEELQHYLAGSDQRETAILAAYADFGSLPRGRDLQRALYLLGAEPQFVPADLQPNASEIQLCVDAMDALNTRPEIRTFAIVTGDRAYLPLVQQFRRHGRGAFVATLTPPSSPDELPPAEDDFFLNARNLLSESARQKLDAKKPAGSDQQEASPKTPSRTKVPTKELDAGPPLHTLEVIEEYFGQYDEVYLTPLLRKLSELLGSSSDPKSIISELEGAGAVRLEKRPGSPYDYTVLIVNEQHPEVQALHERFYGSIPEEAPPYVEPGEDEACEPDAPAEEEEKSEDGVKTPREDDRATPQDAETSEFEGNYMNRSAKPDHQAGNPYT